MVNAPLVFIMVLLVKDSAKLRAREVKDRIRSRLTWWEQGEYAALVQDTVRQCQIRLHRDPPTPTEESRARTFNATVLSGRLRQAVRRLTDRSGGGVLDPTAIDAKTGSPVHEVLRQKHPVAREPPIEALRDLGPAPPSLPPELPAETIERVARRLQGAGGPSGVDAEELRHWLFHFGTTSQRLAEELAAWASWLASASPPWAAYCAFMASHLIAIDKQPGSPPCWLW